MLPPRLTDAAIPRSRGARARHRDAVPAGVRSPRFVPGGEASGGFRWVRKVCALRVGEYYCWRLRDGDVSVPRRVRRRHGLGRARLRLWISIYPAEPDITGAPLLRRATVPGLARRRRAVGVGLVDGRLRPPGLRGAPRRRPRGLGLPSIRPARAALALYSAALFPPGPTTARFSGTAPACADAGARRGDGWGTIRTANISIN